MNRAPARWRRLFAADNGCEHLNVWALSDSLSVLDNEDEAAAAAADLYQCDDCGAVVVPADRPRGFMWRDGAGEG